MNHSFTPAQEDSGPPIPDLIDQVQMQLQEIKLRARNANTVQSHVARLERTNRELEDRNLTLERRVEGLEQRLRRSEIELDVKDRKLKYYRAVIKDAFRNESDEEEILAVDEHDPDHDFAGTHRESEGSNWGIAGEAQEDDDQEIQQGLAENEENESSVDAGEVAHQLLPSSPSRSVSTPVPARSQLPSEGGSSPRHAASSARDDANEAGADISIASIDDSAPRSPTDSGTRMSTSTGVFRLSSVHGSTEAPENDWQIRFADPPNASELKIPISWRRMRENVGLDDDDVAALMSLLNPSSFKLGVAFMGDKAFIHDPFFLEDLSENHSYLIDWGSDRTNQKLARRIEEAGENTDGVFHTFVYVIGRRRWYYVSALKWAVEKVWDIWPTLTPPVSAMYP
ncbi:hypothetical protein V5O48_011354 [Marasmius crinis-equi]|uniref:BZIP domain-containing protein n=1 Tax=Marasmius crinis-equi TaxID=585013 RepID=A0ABR3F672_9AGAR